MYSEENWPVSFHIVWRTNCSSIWQLPDKFKGHFDPWLETKRLLCPTIFKAKAYVAHGPRRLGSRVKSGLGKAFAIKLKAESFPKNALGIHIKIKWHRNININKVKHKVRVGESGQHSYRLHLLCKVCLPLKISQLHAKVLKQIFGPERHGFWPGIRVNQRPHSSNCHATRIAGMRSHTTFFTFFLLNAMMMIPEKKYIALIAKIW